ncbi:unnamed protein product [Protopolystoma xenopodis]|uniref:MD-2-related lipid-recognition domain-containing protein n=1 Tax=Protopolystoma xenopodis TaxID=117903 RepID=A0A448WRP5_9PLAT|nr:unnamed protein product [Protopolystoma xenopodis]
MEASSARFHPKRGSRSHGLRQTERRRKAKRLQYNGIQASSSDVNTPSGTAKATGIISHVPIPFPLDDNKMCDFISPLCPLQEKHVYNYSASFPIKTIYPSLH